MNDQWMAMEHYRMHSVEEWPDGPYKSAALAAIRSKLESLTREARRSIECNVCLSRTLTQLRLAA